MEGKGHFIGGDWQKGLGLELLSKNPATGEVIWQGSHADELEVHTAVESAARAFDAWCDLGFEARAELILTFAKRLKEEEEAFAQLLSQEVGKPLWEARQEVETMLQKIPISIEAQKMRCFPKEVLAGAVTIHIGFKPHGPVGVLGPFNFPGHLPNSHIVPALLAGNTVVFKGSEKTPLVSEKLTELFSFLPPGVLNLVQGGAQTGHALLVHPDIQGIFFTGSYQGGMSLTEAMRPHPEKILILEMGGNNPLIVSETPDLEAAALLAIQSAFLTSGQRCTSARRLIVPTGGEGDEFLKILIHLTESVQVGPFTDYPEPYMGPVIDMESAEKLLTAQAMLGTQGGNCLVEMRPFIEGTPLLTPGIMDVTEIKHREDKELFGPLLQVVRVPNFEAAIQEANQTRFGLSAALLSESREKFEMFYRRIRAGVINWNAPTTGASSRAPFGGVGLSGNHRPGGYFTVDSCLYPTASSLNSKIVLPSKLPPGIHLLGRT